MSVSRDTEGELEQLRVLFQTTLSHEHYNTTEGELEQLRVLFQTRLSHGHYNTFTSHESQARKQQWRPAPAVTRRVKLERYGIPLCLSSLVIDPLL